jgi:5-methylcytosine-specific restriction endonuclease McrA
MESIIHLKDLELERRGKLHSYYDEQRLLERFHGRCSFCDMVPDGSLTLDHLVPRAKGGGDEGYNLFPACRECNGAKDCKDFQPWYERHWSYDRDRLGEILRIHEEEKKTLYPATDYDSLHAAWILNNPIAG